MKIETLPAESTITVDTETLNISDYTQVSGELPELSGGSNTIEYTDNETSRDVRIKISYKPRYL